MKKLVKLSSILSLASVFVLSGCSCTVKEDKYSETVDAIGNSDLLTLDKVEQDFTATYTIISTTVDGVKTETHVVSRDVDSRRFSLTTIRKVVDAQGNETENSDVTRIVYLDSNVTKIATLADDNTLKNIYSTNYGDPKQIFTDNISELLYEEGRIDADYYELIHANYNNYKSIPFNACLSSSDKSHIWGISQAEVDLNAVTCEVTKPLFGKEYTYDVSYRVTLARIRSLSIKANADNKLIYVKQNDEVANNGHSDTFEHELTISYDNVEIKLPNE